MIKMVIATGEMVVVFDEQGEQIPGYQGPYEVVKEKILREASKDTVFAHGVDCSGELIKVPRENW